MSQKIQDGYLEWRPQAEDSLLTPYRSLDNIATENPDRVKTLHAAGIAELERRNADPILINWLKNGAQGGVPSVYECLPTESRELA